MSTERPRLRATGLAVGYGHPPIRSGLELAVPAGQILAVLGPSGSGKSTLLSTLAGVTPALEGRIEVDGIDVTDLPIHERRIGMIFQEPLLFPHLDVIDNVAYGLRRQGQSRATARAQAHDLLGWIGLSGYGHRPVSELSGGQAQRVALARAIAPRPAVLLLDEPFSALDRDLRARLSSEVVELVRDQQVAAVHVTHDPDEAEAMSDSVLRLE